MGEAPGAFPSGLQREIKKGGPEALIHEEQLRVLADAYALVVYSDLPPAAQPALQGRALERLRDLISCPETTLVYEQGELVAVGGYKLHGCTTEEKPVLELTMAIVSPTHQGRNLSPILYEQRMNSIRESYPDSIVSVVSKNPAVHHIVRKQGFTELPLSEYYQMTENDPRVADEVLMRNNGFRAFTFNLGEIKDRSTGTAEDFRKIVPEVLP